MEKGKIQYSDVVTFRLSKADAADLKMAAEASDLTIAVFVRELILKYLDTRRVTIPSVEVEQGEALEPAY